MAFWIAVLIGIIVAFIFSRRGLYEGLILAFNVNLSIYLALYLTPTLLATAPTATDIPGGLALAILVLFAICFGILFGVSFLLFTGQFTVPMAKVLDCVGGGIAGFFTGILGTSFVFLIITLTPIPGVPEYAQNLEVTTNAQVVCSTCDYTHGWIGADRHYKAKDLLAWLNKKAEETPSPFIIDPNSEPNEAPAG